MDESGAFPAFHATVVDECNRMFLGGVGWRCADPGFALSAREGVTAAHLVHGMHGNVVAPTWTALSEQDVAGVLSQYGRRLMSISWHSPRPFSAAAIVATTEGSLFIKRHHVDVRSPQQLEAEHDFIGYVRAQGFVTPEVMRTAAGASVVSVGEYTYEVHAAARGLDIYRDVQSWMPFLSTAHARSAGAALAKLHVAAEGYAAAPRPAGVLVGGWTIVASPDPLREMESMIAARPLLRDALAGRDWRGDVGDALGLYAPGLHDVLREVKPLWTHNDWHASNLTWTAADESAHVVEAIDFGLANRTTAAFDIATAIERNTIAWLELGNGKTPSVQFAHVDALLSGYTSVRPLSAADRSALGVLLPVVHIDFALSELEYFHGVAKSTSDASLAYETYLVDHLHWWQDIDGQRLLARCIVI